MKALPLLLLVSASSALAQTMITYSGKIYSGPSNIGDNVTYTVITSGNSSASFDGNYRYSDEYVSDDADLFLSITGTNLVGSWSRPMDENRSPYSFVGIDYFIPNFDLRVFAGNDSTDLPNSNIGFTFLGSRVHGIYFRTVLNEPFKSIPVSSDFSTFFVPYYGTFSPRQNLSNLLSESYGYIETDAARSSNAYRFTIDSVTYESAVAVPEPSTYGLILGGLALAGAAVRRRKKTV